MLTEEEVEKLEQQRELRERARAATSQEGLMRFREARERERQDQLYRESHGGLSKAEVQAAGPNGSGRQYRAIARGAELQAAREHEMKKFGEEMSTRRDEAFQKRMGMAEQGMEAARMNKDATIRAAELGAANVKTQAKSSERIAGINQKGALEVANAQGEWALKTKKEEGDAHVEAARLTSAATVDAATETAAAQARKDYAEAMVRNKEKDAGEAWKRSNDVMQRAIQLQRNYRKKGKNQISLEEAMQMVRKEMGLR